MASRVEDAKVKGEAKSERTRTDIRGWKVESKKTRQFFIIVGDDGEETYATSEFALLGKDRKKALFTRGDVAR